MICKPSVKLLKKLDLIQKGTARNSLVVFQAVVNRNPAIAGYYKLQNVVKYNQMKIIINKCKFFFAFIIN